MKSEYAGIHIPAGCTMYAGETVDSLVDLGVIPDDVDSQIEITYDVSRVQGSKGETVLESIRNMVAKATTELYQINLEHINMLVGGVMNVTKTAASKVSDEEHVIAKGWAKGALLPLPGRNADGSAPEITQILNGETPLTEATDYIVASADGRYGIIVLDGSSAVPTSPLTVTYSYTPTASVKATMGDGNVEARACVVRFSKTVEGRLFQVTIYKAVKTDGITLGFPAITSEDIPSLPVTMEGRIDYSRSGGDQLLEIVDEIGAL